MKAKPGRQGSNNYHWIFLLACFAITLVASLAHNIFGHNTILTFLFDSGHYLESCRQLTKLVLAACANHFSNWQNILSKQDPGFADLIMLDGPVLPLINVPVFVLLGRLPTQIDWKIFDLSGAVFQALSACLVYAIANRLCQSARWGFAAALLWGLYPAAIAASGRYLNETPTAFLLLALIFLASTLVDPAVKNIPAWAMALGAFSAILLLMRPALFPVAIIVVLLVVAFRYWQKSPWRQNIIVLLGILFGLALTLTPWLAFTQALTGHMTLTPQRAPFFNLAKGIDTQVDGWSAEPTPPLTKSIADNPHPLAAAAESASKHPGQLLSLFLRKLTRLWGSPWNDSRQSVFGISPAWQKWYHILLCVLALAGSLFIIARGSSVNKQQVFLGTACIAVILAHHIYILFETISRYGFTAMPFVIILALYFAYCLWQIKPSPLLSTSMITSLLLFTFGCQLNYAKSLVSLIDNAAFCLSVYYAIQAALLIYFLFTACIAVSKSQQYEPVQSLVRIAFATFVILIVGTATAYATDSRSAPEWQCTLTGSQMAMRTFTISPDDLKDKKAVAAFILVDSNKSIANAQITLNGHAIETAPLPLFTLYPERYYLTDLMRKYTLAVGLGFDDLRHWWAVPVDLADLSLTGSNTIAVSAKPGQAVTIYGEYLTQDPSKQPTLSPDWFSPGHLDNEESDWRLKLNPLAKNTGDAYYLVNNGQKIPVDRALDPGRQSGRYRLQLALNLLPASNAAVNTGNAAQGNDTAQSQGSTFDYTIKPTDFDPLLRYKLGGQELIAINRMISKAAKSVTAMVPIPDGIVKDNYIKITITGSILSTNKQSKIGILPVLLGGKTMSWFMVLPHAPDYIEATNNWQPFEFVDYLPAAAIHGGLKAIVISLYPGPWSETSEYGFDRANGQALLKDLHINVLSLHKTIWQKDTTAIW